MAKKDRTKEYKDLIKQSKIREESRPKPLTQEELDIQTRHWCTFYRRNINLYAKDRLKIRLHLFQHVMLYLMGVSDVFFAICSRGLSKTMTIGLFAICKSMLLPYSEIVITAMTIPQATRMVKDKMENELCKKLSPTLKYFYEKGLIKFSYGQEQIIVDFSFNGSQIIILPAMEQSRGQRATVLIYEECRLLKKGIIDSVFEKMAHPRQAMFMTKPEYAGNKLYIEECISIYITSARFKSEWFWRTFKEVVTGCYMDSKVKYNFYAGDIFLAINHGLKTWGDLAKAKRTSSEMEIRMEDYNEMVGEIEDAYFTLESFRKNQILHRAFQPPTLQEFNERIDLKNHKKKENEYRTLFIDYAFANTTSKEANDMSIIGCMSMYFDGEKIARNIDYLETHSGGDSEGMQLRIRELYWDYESDFIVLDLRSGGEVHYNNLTKQFDHPERNSKMWNSQGFTVYNNAELHVVPQAKLDDLQARTIDAGAIPCIIPIVATGDLNSKMWQEMSKRLRDGDIRFLIDEMDLQLKLDSDKKYATMTSEERMRVKLPYVQTLLMINEAINLTPSWNNGTLKLETSRLGLKDRIVACVYGNYFATLFENKLAKECQSNETDINDWTLIV